MACVITRYECPNNSEAIDAQRKNANTQQANTHGFSDVFPWLFGCDGISWHYVARIPDGPICGWLTATLKSKFGRKYVYLTEISVIRIQDERFRGVGRRLHDRLLEDAKANDLDFIYLYPLNEGVAATYTRWGYERLRAAVKHQFFILKRGPPSKLLDTFMPTNPRTFLSEAHDLAARDPKDDELVKLIEKKRRELLERPELLKDLATALETIGGIEAAEASEEGEDEEPMSIEEKRDMIKEVLARVQGGRRKKTRRTKGKRVSTRKTRFT